jgi:putative transcriptional regulator
LKRDWLIKILKKTNLTHQEAATLSHMERSYFTQIVNGDRRPSPETAQRMGKALKFNWTIFFVQECGEKPQSELLESERAATLSKTG